MLERMEEAKRLAGTVTTLSIDDEPFAELQGNWQHVT